MRCAKVVELATGERQNCNLQVCHFRIGNGWIGAESATELSVHVVGCDRTFGDMTFGSGMLHEYLYSTVAEYPHTDICKIEVVGSERSQSLNRRFLKHTLKLCRLFACRHEHAMILGGFGSEPQSVAYNVSPFRYGWQW